MYNRLMLRINLYLIEEQNRKNVCLAKSDSTHNLFKLADLAEALPGKGPVDLSANLDKYAWD